eukprot:4669475-Lingulodinium_polyedra.AAC.1
MRTIDGPAFAFVETIDSDEPTCGLKAWAQLQKRYGRRSPRVQWLVWQTSRASSLMTRNYSHSVSIGSQRWL